MTTIEHRVEAKSVQPNYSGKNFTEAEIEAGAHRRFIGGSWDTHGAHQLEFLKKQGLRPADRLLDIGCGCFRAGREFIDYLEPAHYFGIDANLSLVQTGYDVELSDEQRRRLPVGNLRATDRFDGDFGQPIDFALAQSVFSHVSLNHIRLCLYRTAKVMRPGGSFFATFYEQPARTPVDKILSPESWKPLYYEKNAYWYYRSDLKWAAKQGPWRFNYIGDWGHPAGQMMVQFVRLTEAEVAARDASKPRGRGATASARARNGALRAVRWAERRLRTD